MSVKTFEIQVPDEVATKIEAAAHERGLSIDELVRASVEEKLARDSALDVAANYVLAKNTELYDRLS